ncbi:MAG: hypothetical protein Q7V56_02905 [Gammaproteobacteria bacterium]|nr:hypothetical protein [Gammaproteobacteria bacterium]
MFSKPVSHSPQRIYHMKAVCGGGKSYAMLKHIRESDGGWYIYAVPTIALATEIEAAWEIDNATSQADSLRAGELTVIHCQRTSKESGADRRRELEEILRSPSAKNTVLITHEFLLGDLFNPKYGLGELLSNWHIIIDEDPEVITAPGFQDNGNAYSDLSAIAKPQCEIGRFSVLEVSRDHRRRLRELTMGTSNDTQLHQNVRALCEAIVADRNAKLLAKPSLHGYLYYLVSAKPLARLVAAAGRVTILASRLTGLTRLYLDKCGIEIRVSEIVPDNSSYPKQLQERISVWRVWERGNMSKQRIDEYGVTAALNQVEKQLTAAGNCSTFLLRANDANHKEARGHPGVLNVVSKVTKGLNSYSNCRAVVDIASYNRNSLYSEAYELLDQLLEVGKGTWQAAVEETHSELSAQAAFRIGIRRIHDGPLDATYLIVLPDLRTEDYMRKVYLPHAAFRGAMLDDGREGKSRGRPKGSATDENIREVRRMTLSGTSVRAACANVGISRSTYAKYIQ